MQYVTIENLTQPLEQPIMARYCDSFTCKLRGLTFFPSLKPGGGLVMAYERASRLDAAIHMWFMRFGLCVVWLNSEGEVVDVKLARPWALAYVPNRPAQYVLELHMERLGEFKIGDRVRLVKV